MLLQEFAKNSHKSIWYFCICSLPGLALEQWQRMTVTPEPIDKMGIHALPLAKRGQQQTLTKGTLKFHPPLSKESGTSQVAKKMQKAAKIYWFTYWFWQGEKVCFLLVFQVVFCLIFMGSKSINYNWKKQGPDQQVLEYWLESIDDAQGSIPRGLL